MYKSKSNKQSATDRLEKLQESMWDQVSSYMEDPQQLLEYFKFLRQFHQYSVHNRMMIKAQFPGAVAVGSFKYYQEHDVHIKKGSKAIKIMVPSTASYFWRNTDQGKKKVSLKYATKEERAKIKDKKIEVLNYRYYVLGNVFDVTQTDLPKDQYPELFPNLHKDFQTDQDYNHAMIVNGVNQILAQLGVKRLVATRSNWRDGSAKGFYAPAEKVIILNPDNTPSENDAVLLHELGHAILHSKELNSIQKHLHLEHHKTMKTSERELEAEMTAYLVCSQIGIDITDEAVRYIASWTSNGNNIDKQRLTTFFDEVVKVSDYVSDTILKQQKDDNKIA